MKESYYDRDASPQRIASLQALADLGGDWRRIDNRVLRVLANPYRRVTVVEKKLFQVKHFTITSYRLTPAGYRLLARWKSSMEEAV